MLSYKLITIKNDLLELLPHILDFCLFLIVQHSLGYKYLSDILVTAAGDN